MKNESCTVGIIMGSRSDASVAEAAVEMLDRLRISSGITVASAHRDPDKVRRYANGAERRGIRVILAIAGLAAALPGVVASHTLLPVIGVPVVSGPLRGIDAILSMMQMPGGVPVGTLAIGMAGAINAALLAASIVGGSRPEIREAVRTFRADRTRQVLDDPDPRIERG